MGKGPFLIIDLIIDRVVRAFFAKAGRSVVVDDFGVVGSEDEEAEERGT